MIFKRVFKPINPLKGHYYNLALNLGLKLKPILDKGNCKVTINLFSLLQFTEINLKIWQYRSNVDKTAQLIKFFFLT